MAGPIATALGLGAEEDQVNATVAFFKNPYVAGTLGAVAGLATLGIVKVVLGHPATQTVVEVVTGKGK